MERIMNSDNRLTPRASDQASSLPTIQTPSNRVNLPIQEGHVVVHTTPSHLEGAELQAETTNKTNKMSASIFRSLGATLKNVAFFWEWKPSSWTTKLTNGLKEIWRSIGEKLGPHLAPTTEKPSLTSVIVKSPEKSSGFSPKDLKELNEILMQFFELERTKQYESGCRIDKPLSHEEFQQPLLFEVFSKPVLFEVFRDLQNKKIDLLVKEMIENPDGSHDIDPTLYQELNDLKQRMNAIKIPDMSAQLTSLKTHLVAEEVRFLQDLSAKLD